MRTYDGACIDYEGAPRRISRELQGTQDIGHNRNTLNQDICSANTNINRGENQNLEDWHVPQNTCVSAPPSAFNWVAPRSTLPMPSKKLRKTLDFAEASICLPSSVLIIPGWSALEVTPVPLSCLASSLENRIFASLLWPYALLLLRYNIKKGKSSQLWRYGIIRKKS